MSRSGEFHLSVVTVGKRVAAQDRPMQVNFNGEIVAEDATPATLGMLPMDFVEVSYR